MRLPLFFASALGLILGAALAVSAQGAEEKKVTVNKTNGSAKASKSEKNKPAAKKMREAKSKSKEAVTLPWPQNVIALAGEGAVLVTDPYKGEKNLQELYSLNADKLYVPASILKLLTAAAALDFLGPKYRFRTDFYLDSNGGLWIKGRGDPFLVSEELCHLADALVEKGLKQVSDVYLDASFFLRGLILDGTTFTDKAYDAFNGALGVNFNTVTYLIDRSGKIVESDSCTPLTGITLDLAEKNRPKKKKRGSQGYRININDNPKTAEIQAGQIIAALLKTRGVEISGSLILGKTVPPEAKLIYSHLSSKDLEGLLVDILKNSNNFMTNQVFLTLGAEKYDSPGTLEKSQRAVNDFLDKYGLSRITFVEGSGLSRQNFLTARQMSQLLKVLTPARHLVKSSDDGQVLYKTGTMSDIQTLAGWLVNPKRPEQPLNFVILLNGAYKPGTRDKILKALKEHFLNSDDQAAKATGRS
ncbi:MAG: D-alanyl-D-alanine carboxypeptidase [Deltaproteobacteria bacterium]|jgi:D-alanyl-D-alanine carboxypeptidase/D-alanyl-D-alanine-endopeptidase (penicillin-binding protein 4)|nr:D-alanyl-D-alanine carboxypeptidase [Deltaproteobacteria bacterium]